MQQTLSQRLSQAAYPLVAQRRQGGKLPAEYVTFAKKFPALVHTCGLAQAVAFAEAKGETDYLHDLALVLAHSKSVGVKNEKELADKVRQAQILEYMRLSQRVIDAASWLKRYVEALDSDQQA
ncbi:MAG: hypothetical protein KatS3mg114_1396 [Planctomycetaceae bacterium]|nr:MAG: hypothetical protein KatS3mg114_1396 [Planctomycetaceae bacterium]